MRPINSTKTTLLTLVLLGMLTGAAAAADPEPAAKEHLRWHSGNYWGAGVQISQPYQDFADQYSTGYGLQGMFNYPLIPVIDLSASVGWNHFPQEGDGAGIDIFELSAGARFALGVFFMNGEAGFYSKVEEWSFVPGLGLRFDHWEYSFRIKAAGGNSWSGFRVGYYF